MAALPFLAADAIVFSIHAAVKLGDNLRKAYVQSLRAKALFLPLPDIDIHPNQDTISIFFNDHPKYIDRLDDLSALHKKAKTSDLTEEEKKQYETFYNYSFEVEEGSKDLPALSADGLISMFKIRQWEKGKAPTTALQLVAGTLVEIGIDYFNNVPGALNPDSPKGKLIRQFLAAFDGISLADNPDLNKTLNQELLPRLFTTVAESIGALSNEITGDKKVQALIQATAHGIAKDIFDKSKNFNENQQQEAIHWGQMLLGSMIRNAGTYVLSSPESILDTNDGVSAIIQSGGLVLLDAIISADTGKVSIKNAITPQTLDQITKATLGVIAEHPEVISGERGIKEIIQSVAIAAQENNIAERGYFPELARMVLEKSIGRLESMWLEKTDGRPEHLLVVAAAEVMKTLTKPPSDAERWSPKLSKTQLLGIAEELLDTVAHNPSWILDKIKGQSALAVVMEATMGALQKLPKGERVAPETFRQILKLGLQTTLVNRKVLDTIKWGTELEETTILSKGIDLVLTCIFTKDGPAEVNRISMLSDLLEYATQVILRQHPDENGLILLNLVLFESGVDFSRGFDTKFADQILEAALSALATHPELVAKPEMLRQLLAGVAASLNATQLRKPGLLPKIIQMVLRQTAMHAHLWVKTKEEELDHLLLVALKNILPALAATDATGAWKPSLNDNLAETLIEDLLDEVVQNPSWVIEKIGANSLMADVLGIVFAELEHIPKTERLSPETLRHLIKLSLNVAATSPKLLEKIKFAEDKEEQEILHRALALLFAYLFRSEKDQQQRKLLQKELITYGLDIVMSRAPDAKGLIVLELILSEDNGVDFSLGLRTKPLERLVEVTLSMLERYPELVTQDRKLSQTIANMAAVLRDSKLDQPELLAELIRFTLAHLGKHVELLMNGERANGQHILFFAAGQVFTALAQAPETGHWKPKLSNEQIMEILAIVYQKVSENRQWMQKEPIIFKLINEVFKALDEIPDYLTIPFTFIRKLIDQAMSAVNQQRKLLADIEITPGHTQSCLLLALGGFFKKLFRENPEEESTWYLTQTDALHALLDAFLALLANTNAGISEVEKTLTQLEEAIATWKTDFTRDLQDILIQLKK